MSFGAKIFFRSKFKVEWENGVWTKVRFFSRGFLFTYGYFTFVFDFLDRIFFLNGFPNPSIVRSRSSFLFSQWKFFEMYVRTCPAMFFLIRRLHRWFLRRDFLELTFSMTSVTSTTLPLKFVRDVISAFSSIAWLTSQKNHFRTHLWNFNFYEHLLVKDQ